MLLTDAFSAVLVSCLSAAASGMAGCAIYYARHAIRANRKETDAIRTGLQAMLRNRLICSMLTAEEHGWSSLREVENVALMLKAYEGLGGNGLVEGLYERFRKLPHVAPGRRGEE